MKIAPVSRQTLRRILVLLAMATPCGYAQGMQLVSIQGIEMDPDSYVAGISINTWGVRIRGVCHIPNGWILEAGNSIDPGGIVRGGASGFVANLSRKDVGQLGNLFLIDDPRPGEQSSIPMFAGVATVGLYHAPTHDERDIRLGPANFALRGAPGCPPSDSDTPNKWHR